ncbi:MAG TPA: hypothetical protein VKY19_29120 [Ktedonosporobacter sp.]|jgi:DNA repair exonuclease SbcCD ATPase subunit|nr:hypothetical protein [Ktedonosporobacter sp.]
MSVTPSSTVVGIFRDRAMAEDAIGALYDAGFQREQIRYSMPGNAGGFFEDLKNMFTGASSTDTNGDHLTDDLTGMGLSDEEARYYTDEYNNGNTILTVQAANREQEALSILHQHGAYNSCVSPGAFSETNVNEQQRADYMRQDHDTTPGQGTDIGDWETQRLPRTSEEHPVHNEEHDAVRAEQERADQEPPAGPAGEHQETYASQANNMTPEHDANYQEARSDEVMPERDVDHPASHSEFNPVYQTSQANGVATGHEDELQQLQAQIRSLQQQLEEAKAQLQTAREHETHLQTAREREQQLQSSRQQMQDLQAELDATLAELRETQSRIGQYR